MTSPRFRFTTVALALALATASLACEKETAAPETAKPAPATPAAPGPTRATTPPPPKVDDTPSPPPVVTLLEPGAAPRRELRLAPKVGARQRMQLTMRMTMEMAGGPMVQPPMKLPAMIMIMDMTVKAMADGVIDYEFVLSDTQVADEGPPQIVSGIRTALAGAKGLAGAGRVTIQGVNLSTELKLPDSTPPQLRQLLGGMKDSFNSMSAPLPAEPVGKGAKWQVDAVLKQNGMKLEQRTVFELVSLAGSVVKTKSVVTQHAAPQTVATPTGPPAELMKLEASGTGEVDFDLSKIVPPRGVGDMRSESTVGVGTGATRQQMTMKMSVNVAIESK